MGALRNGRAGVGVPPRFRWAGQGRPRDPRQSLLQARTGACASGVGAEMCCNGWRRREGRLPLAGHPIGANRRGAGASHLSDAFPCALHSRLGFPTLLQVPPGDSTISHTVAALRYLEDVDEDDLLPVEKDATCGLLPQAPVGGRALSRTIPVLTRCRPDSVSENVKSTPGASGTPQSVFSCVSRARHVDVHGCVSRRAHTAALRRSATRRRTRAPERAAQLRFAVVSRFVSLLPQTRLN